MVGRKLLLSVFAALVVMAPNAVLDARAADEPDSLAKLRDTFSWAGGIEDTFIPQIKPGLRRLEEYELTQHYDQWKADLDRAKSLGLTKLRWGVPWYKVEPKEGEFDWTWTDKVISYMVDDLKIDPIIDLVHYGTPMWMEQGFLDPQYPEKVATYARAFAHRYKGKVKYYTPTNEPAVTAEFCGLKGEWPPYLTGEKGYVKVLLPVVRGIQEIGRALREEDDDATLVAVEAMRYVAPADDASKKAAEQELARDLLPWDLASGKVDHGHAMYEWLHDNGADDAQLDELEKHAIAQDVFGVNFYPWSIKAVHDAGGGKTTDVKVAPRGRLLVKVLQNVADHVGSSTPLFVTETSANGDTTARALWMSETVDAVRLAREKGVQVVGYTWFPIITMVDWQYRTSKKPMEDFLLHLGLWDSKLDGDGALVRQPTSLVEDYREWISVGMPRLTAVAK
jgi:beta-glucosidase/6-phospho-beta-glucosidase/beta-galactosidase